jgi:transcription initiation factor TFIIB
VRGYLVARLNGGPICPECRGTSLLRDYETGELVCQSCGYVLSSTILDQGPEWRAFDQEQKDRLTRVGEPETWTIHDKGLSTTIDISDRDATGRSLRPNERAKLYRLRKWHRRIKVSDSIQRNLSHALSEISKLSYSLNLPRNVVETSSVIYRRAIQMRLIRGRAIRYMAVASIYMACRQCGVLRSLNDVAEAADISRKDAARNYRFLVKKLKASVPQVDPQGYISKIVIRLGLKGETERLAKVILKMSSEMKLTSGRSASGIAAACVYISCKLTGERKTQGDIAREAQVTEVTIRNRYKELEHHLMFSLCL